VQVAVAPVLGTARSIRQQAKARPGYRQQNKDTYKPLLNMHGSVAKAHAHLRTLAPQLAHKPNLRGCPGRLRPYNVLYNTQQVSSFFVVKENLSREDLRLCLARERQHASDATANVSTFCVACPH
jgi:hypothetical protein